MRHVIYYQNSPFFAYVRQIAVFDGRSANRAEILQVREALNAEQTDAIRCGAFNVRFLIGTLHGTAQKTHILLTREQLVQKRADRQASFSERDSLDSLAFGHAELAAQLAPCKFQKTSSRSARVWIH